MIIKVKLRDLKKGDNVAIFRPYEKEKYTIIDVGLREDSNGEEVVGVVMRSDAGHVRVPPYMPADNEVTLWEEITEDTELDCVISVDSDGYTFKTFNTTIDYLNSIYSDLVQILANIDGKYRTIWEREDHGSN